jgi:tetrahydromethanopterin S-methyltransferase subunit G
MRSRVLNWFVGALFVLTGYAVSGFLCAQERVPLPAPPTKAQLYQAVRDQLDVDAVVGKVISDDPYLSTELRRWGIQDVTKVPYNTGVPHTIISGWKGQSRFKVALVDNTMPTTSQAIDDHLKAINERADTIEEKVDRAVSAVGDLAKKLDGSITRLGGNSAIMQGTLDTIRDRLDDKLPPVPVPAPAPAPAPRAFPFQPPK